MPWKERYTVSDERTLEDADVSWPGGAKCGFTVTVDLSLARTGEGITAADMRSTDAAFGFVALLGVIALAGMIMRNTIILVDQIGQDLRAGLSAEEAIIGSTVRRARPVVLTALAAAFAFVPLALNVFWGPMAIAMIGGLMVATVLTLLFLPALYAWAAVARPPVQDAAGPYPAGTPASSSPAA